MNAELSLAGQICESRVATQDIEGLIEDASQEISRQTDADQLDSKSEESALSFSTANGSKEGTDCVR